MKRTPTEQSLERMLSYLQLAGIESSTQISRIALQAVQDALEGGDNQLVERVMDRLGTRFSLPSTDIPSPCPPLSRASIGYDPD